MKSFAKNIIITPPKLRCNAAIASNMAAAKPKKTLISFDVDGTLIRSIGSNSNKLHKEAFSAAFKNVFDLDTNIDVIPHHGSTDGLILISVCVHHGIPHQEAMEKLPLMQQVMIDHFLNNASENAGTGLEVLPGVATLLEYLSSRDDVVTCLVTGNLEPIGWSKMDALGIKHLFSTPNFGGFGSDFCSGNYQIFDTWKDRAEFVKIAAHKCAKNLGLNNLVDIDIDLARYHVGDAPMDVQAAAAAGAVPVGVTTGIYKKEELENACPEAIILDGLHDIDRVLNVFHLV